MLKSSVTITVDAVVCKYMFTHGYGCEDNGVSSTRQDRNLIEEEHVTRKRDHVEVTDCREFEVRLDSELLPVHLL